MYALFLGDLSTNCDERDLEETFAPYGAILEIRIKRCKETAKTLSYGFLEFVDPAHAVNAMNALDGAILKGRPLRYVEGVHVCCNIFCFLIFFFFTKPNCRGSESL